MLVMAIGATALGAAGTAWHTESRREKEAQLLFIGEEFKRAIASYYHATPGAAKQLPRKLDDLLRDPRYPTVKRHLRKIYVDPMTGKADWGLIMLPEGIHGVHSHSQWEPFKGRDARVPDLATSNIKPGVAQLQATPGRTRYADWSFIADLSRGPTSPSQGAPGAPTSERTRRVAPPVSNGP